MKTKRRARTSPSDVSLIFTCGQNHNDSLISNRRRQVQSHDVVFLLTDTREARWLPTVLCAAHDKPLLNAALGLDTFLVMRHGAGAVPTSEEAASADGAAETSERLGCYFCNDVVAPEDSTRDRTLDQQCTVARPGLAPIASALAVELLVALLHHPALHRAPADTAQPVLSSITDEHKPLGLLPHQIRGFLTHHTMVLPKSCAFERCTACSAKVVGEYKARGFDFVKQVCNEAGNGYLEKLTGLDELLKSAEAADVDWDSESDTDTDAADGACT